MPRRKDAARVTEMLSVGEVLEEARVAAGLTQQQLLFRFQLAGGDAYLSTLITWLKGSAAVSVYDYSILARALNRALEERSSDLRINDPLDFLVPPREAGGGSAASRASSQMIE